MKLKQAFMGEKKKFHAPFLLFGGKEAIGKGRFARKSYINARKKKYMHQKQNICTKVELNCTKVELNCTKPRISQIEINMRNGLMTETHQAVLANLILREPREF